MTPARIRWILYTLLFCIAVGVLYLRSDHYKLIKTDQIYSELHHPSWSLRVLRAKTVRTNYGSGDHRILYLVDVRRVTVPIDVALRHYEHETDRLGFRECHVDGYQAAHDKFEDEWRDMCLLVPERPDVIIISQRFTTDSTIRRHEAKP